MSSNLVDVGGRFRRWRRLLRRHFHRLLASDGGTSSTLVSSCPFASSSFLFFLLPLRFRPRPLGHGVLFSSSITGLGFTSTVARPVFTAFYRVSHDSFGFYWVSWGLTRFDCGFTGFYWVLLGFTAFYRVSLGSTRFQLVFTGFQLVLTGFHWVLLGFTGFYWVLLGFTGFYWVLSSFTGFNSVPTGFYWVSWGFTGFHWVLLGFTGF